MNSSFNTPGDTTFETMASASPINVRISINDSIANRVSNSSVAFVPFDISKLTPKASIDTMSGALFKDIAQTQPSINNGDPVASWGSFNQNNSSLVPTLLTNAHNGLNAVYINGSIGAYHLW